MGRRLLLIALLALASGCGRESRPAHAELPCAQCHDGAPTARVDSATSRRVNAASSDACLSCHAGEDGGRVAFGVVEFEHRDHAGDSALASGCAACHTHDSGADSLTVSSNGCALCHAAQLDGSEPTECRTCHVDPAHAGFTSQGVPVVHGALPWIGGECIRCHFDVGQPSTAVASSACVDCHVDAAEVAEQGAGRDLHPSHTGVTCSTCHVDVEHHIGAMSSSVALRCEQCHAGPHELDPAEPLASDAAACNACHAGAHAAQQRMVLGVAPAGVPAAPADKFLDGLTCRSCHVAGPADDSTGGTRVTCTTCHPAQYEQVLDWWNQGTRERVGDARRYVAVAVERAGRSGSAEARGHAAAADSLLRFVTDGDAAHNLPLSHDALAAAVARAASALAATGGGAPAAPDLGRRPRMGQCTYCHYVWREPRFESDMPDAFHRDVMERGRAAARQAEVHDQ